MEDTSSDVILPSARFTRAPHMLQLSKMCPSKSKQQTKGWLLFVKLVEVILHARSP